MKHTWIDFGRKNETIESIVMVCMIHNFKKMRQNFINLDDNVPNSFKHLLQESQGSWVVVLCFVCNFC